MSTLKKGDIGSVITITITEDGVALDISDAITKTIKIRRADDEVVEWDGEFATDGEDGVLEYTTAEGDLDYPGTWMGQVFLVTPTGQWHTDLFTFNVEHIIES